MCLTILSGMFLAVCHVTILLCHLKSVKTLDAQLTLRIGY